MSAGTARTRRGFSAKAPAPGPIGLLAMLLLALAVSAGPAAGEEPAPAAGSPAAAPRSAGPSPFEGVWVGAWPGWRNSSASQAIRIEIAKGGGEGTLRVEYSWEAGPPASGFSQTPGSIQAKGRVDGDRLLFGWQNKQGREFEVTLARQGDDKVKARIDKSGPTGPNERPYNETILNRK